MKRARESKPHHVGRSRRQCEEGGDQHDTHDSEVVAACGRLDVRGVFVIWSNGAQIWTWMVEDSLPRRFGHGLWKIPSRADLDMDRGRFLNISYVNDPMIVMPDA